MVNVVLDGILCWNVATVELIYLSMIMQLRKGFYNITVAFRDAERQRRGAITVLTGFRPIQQSSGDDDDLIWKHAKLNEGSCMRLSAIHLLINNTDETMKEKVALMFKGFNNNIQVRFRMYQGGKHTHVSFLLLFFQL